MALSLTSRYGFALSGHDAFVALNALYQGERFSSFKDSTISPNYEMPAYTQFDLAGGVNLGRFDVGLYVRNLTDKRGVIGAATSETLAVNRTYVKVITPRTLGVTLSASF